MTPVQMTHRIAIETHYLGPTNYRGSRIVARTANGQRLTIGWDHALDASDNHAAAAAALYDRMVIERAWSPGRLIGGAGIDGYVFVMVDDREDAA